MASIPTVSCLQNKSLNHMRILPHQELNKVSLNSRVMPNTTQFPKRGAENKDPNRSTKPAKGTNQLTGNSRLPVLAKSQLSASKDVSSNTSHRRWEERSFLGKAQKTKRCTKTVPFSFSQSQTHNQKCNEATSKSTDKSGKQKSHLTQHIPAKTLSISQPGSSADAIQKDLSTKLGNITLAHTQLAKEERFSSKAHWYKDQTDFCLITKPTIQSHVSSDRETGLSEESVNVVPSSQTPRVSKCSSAPDTSVYLPQRVSVKKKKGSGAEAVSECSIPFSPDLSALRSILLNEGIKVGGPDVATSRVSTCPSAQRVPIKKTPTHAATFGKVAGGAEAFSPDPSALKSILLNEGLKYGSVRTPRAPSVYSAQRVPVKKTFSETSTAAGPVTFSPEPSTLLHNPCSSGVTTPRVPFCPSRSTIRTAQRVPVKKDLAGEAAHTGNMELLHLFSRLFPNTGSQGSAGAYPSTHSARGRGIRQTVSRDRTPQRVPASQCRFETRLNSLQKAHPLNISPGFGEPQDVARFPQQEEEVVQRLFQEEPEHEKSEQMENSEDEVTPGETAHHQQSAETESKHETEPRLTGIETLPAPQPFIQAPNRQSVIVFSSGQKLLPRDGASTQTLQHAAQLQPFADRTNRSQSKPILESNRPVTPGKQCKSKASSLSLAVCALKRRLPPLEDMFLDEECAMYTSHQQSWPSQPRCLNPVASTLLFQASTCFVPIIMTAQSHNPVPQISSPIKCL